MGDEELFCNAGVIDRCHDILASIDPISVLVESMVKELLGDAMTDDQKFLKHVRENCRAWLRDDVRLGGLEREYLEWCARLLKMLEEKQIELVEERAMRRKAEHDLAPFCFDDSGKGQFCCHHPWTAADWIAAEWERIGVKP